MIKTTSARNSPVLAAFFSIFALLASMAKPDSLLFPSGPIILQVRGSIERTSDGTTATFDLKNLESLGLVEIKTESPWTDGMAAFQGVPIKALADYLGAKGDRMRFVALDDYKVDIPISDLEAYQPILATRRDGEPMKIRDKGPVWVIYPWSDNPDLQTEEHYAKAIWQVFQITFE